MGDFYSLKTATISNDILSLEYLLDAGPRIVRLFYNNSRDNILAEIPNKTHNTEFGTYFFRGGHRLWHAPEDSLRTYIPDNEPVSCTPTSNGVVITQPVERGTGIQKSLKIVFDKTSARISLHHTLHNQGLWSVSLSAWAITQLPLGGTAVFPQPIGAIDSHGLLPNRKLVLWPYTSLKDQRIHLDDEYITIEATPSLPPLKLGYANNSGWVAYQRNDVIFAKYFTPQPDQPHVDFGCNVETYCDDQFIELETLSPLTTLAPGQALRHTEIWEILPHTPDLHNLNDISQLVSQRVNPNLL